VAILAVIAMISLHDAGRAQGSNLRILTPPQGAKLTSDIATVQYELMNPAVADDPSPTYQLQLDGQDPVRTVDTSYTFTGLAPGPHTVVVQLVDANGTPIGGATNAVQFVVLPIQPDTGSTAPEATDDQSGVGANPRSLQRASLAEDAVALPQRLPEAGSPLPLFSIIGFGVLLGGIVSAMKTR
jgi:hypothetical protein